MTMESPKIQRRRRLAALAALLLPALGGAGSAAANGVIKVHLRLAPAFDARPARLPRPLPATIENPFSIRLPAPAVSLTPGAEEISEPHRKFRAAGRSAPRRSYRWMRAGRTPAGVGEWVPPWKP